MQTLTNVGENDIYQNDFFFTLVSVILAWSRAVFTSVRVDLIPQNRVVHSGRCGKRISSQRAAAQSESLLL